MKVVEINCHKECACSASVGIWNYCDLEHVTFMHKGFKKYQPIYETPNTICALVTMNMPLIPFLTVESLVIQILHDKNTLKIINEMMGISVLSTIKIKEIRKDFSTFDMSYKYIFTGWKQCFASLIEPILKRLVVFWNNRQWQEDLPIKLRRQKVLRLGFMDFKGLPENVEDRNYNGSIECQLPVPRLKNSLVKIPKYLI